MKKKISIILLLLPYLTFAQNTPSPKKISVTIGKSIHGTGDMRGIFMSTDYSKFFKKRMSWTLTFSGTLHSGSTPLFFYAPNGEYTDGSIRYTAGGIQFSAHYGFSFIKKNKHELTYRLGALLRYQSSSYYDQLEILYPALTNLPFPVIVFNNTTPQNTIAIGGSTQLLYNYTFRKNITIGTLAGFQIDSNGDVISQLSLSIGKRF